MKLSERLKNIQMSMPLFFNAGRITFLIVLLCKVFELFYFWKKMFITSKITNIAMVIFYIMLTLMFNMQYKNLKMAPKPLSEGDLDNIIKEVEKG